jgi:hypothetical protein
MGWVDGMGIKAGVNTLRLQSFLARLAVGSRSFPHPSSVATSGIWRSAEVPAVRRASSASIPRVGYS